MKLKFLKNNLLIFFWRLSRKILSILRNENNKDPSKNGEYWFINKIVQLNLESKNEVFFDIGAFKGEWTLNLKKSLGKNFFNKKIYLFEPSPSTFKFLKKKLISLYNLNIYDLAFSSSISNTSFFYSENLDGTNSFSNFIYTKSDLRKKKINLKTETIDNFVSKKVIKKIRYVKCDVEGFDFEVIKGARKCFDKDLIDFFQFEYNHRWVQNKAFLKDVFDFLDKTNYKLGKICPNKIQVLSSWHPELEKFNETNYVIINQNFLNSDFCYNVMFNIYNVMVYE